MTTTLSGFDLRYDNVAEIVNVGDSVEVVINDNGVTREGVVESVGENEIGLEEVGKLRSSSLSVIFEATTGYGFEARKVIVR